MAFTVLSLASRVLYEPVAFIGRSSAGLKRLIVLPLSIVLYYEVFASLFLSLIGLRIF